MKWLVAAIALSLMAARVRAEVRVVVPPHAGAAPDAEVDGHGRVHLVDVVGENAEYVRSADGGRTWSAPIRVNSGPDSVHPAHLFRGPDLAIGRDDRVHLVWYGNG